LKTAFVEVGSGKVVVYQAFLQAFPELRFAKAGVDELLEVLEE
jgi:hypothetical protein